MNFKRISRTFICLLLVCTLLIGVFPVQSDAIALTATAATGVAATLFSMAMGVVFVDLTAELIEGIGKDFSTSMVEWGEANDKSEAVSGWLDGFTIGWDEKDFDGVLSIPADLLSGAVDWAKGLIKGDGVEVEEESEAPEGYAYYNGVLLPIISESPYSHPHCLIYKYSSGTYGLIYSAMQLYAKGLTDTGILSGSSGGYRQVYTLTDQEWKGSAAAWLNGNSVCTSGVSLVWSNYDIFDYSNSSFVWLSASDPIYVGTQTTTVEPSTYVGDIPQQVQDGTFEEEKYKLLYINYSQLFQGQTDAVTALNNVAEQLQNQSLTYAQYMEMIRTQADAGTDDEDKPIVAPIEGTLAGADADTFLERLVDIITPPFEWIWSKIENFFGPWIDRITTGFSNVVEGIKAIPSNIADVFTDVKAGVVALPDTLSRALDVATTAVLNGIRSLFVPSEDYLTNKVGALCVEFAFADSIVRTADELKVGLAGVTTEPPVIYINLGDTRGSYDIGGEVPFLDLRWYSEYKGTVDAIISAFLWICFAWRMFLKLPGIINGMPGDFVMTSAHNMGITDYLPSRSKEYEIQRISNREMIRRGPDK